MKLSFVIPCRNNLVYFKWAYNSIRKNQGDHEVFICAADDASTDGATEHFHWLAQIDPKFSYITNPGPNRVGHTILYDRIINELVHTDIAIIYHADMYLCPGALDEIEKLMYTSMRVEDPINYEESYKYKVDKITETFINDNINNTKIRIQQHSGSYITTNEDGTTDLCWSGWILPVTANYKTIVSLTRIEPPLHPDGPEKYLADWGMEPDQFNEKEFLNWYRDGYKPKYSPPYTNGIFAPWAFFVEDFKKIGGHDPLYRPQSKEDSDIFNRFKLNGCKFVQTWVGCVYHITCRGSRFNPTLTTPGTNSLEWEAHNIRSARNFIRKWGSFVEHTPLMDPIITPKYYTRYNIINCTKSLIELIEPWADLIRCDLDPKLLKEYCDKESKYTDFDLGMKFNYQGLVPSVTVAIDGNHFGNDEYQYLQLLPKIVQDTLLNKKSTEGTFKLGSLFVQISNNEEMTNTLIHVDNEEYQSRLRR